MNSAVFAFSRKIISLFVCFRKIPGYIHNYDIDVKLKNFDIDMTNEVPQDMIIVKVPSYTKEGNETLTVKYQVPPPPRPPLPDSRDTHLPEFQTPEKQFWIEYLIGKYLDTSHPCDLIRYVRWCFISEIRDTFKKNRYTFVNGEQMKEILKHVFDATEKDLQELENSCDNMNHDPQVKARTINTYRLGLDLELGTGM